MPRYLITLSGYRLVGCSVTVDATNEDEARDMAVDAAGSFDWSSDGIDDIEVTSSRPVHDDFVGDNHLS